MNDEFLNEYFSNLNKKLENETFISSFKKEFDALDEETLKNLIETHF